MKKNSLPEKLFAKKLGHDKNALGSSLCQRNTVSKGGLRDSYQVAVQVAATIFPKTFILLHLFHCFFHPTNLISIPTHLYVKLTRDAPWMDGRWYQREVVFQACKGIKMFFIQRRILNRFAECGKDVCTFENCGRKRCLLCIRDWLFIWYGSNASTMHVLCMYCLCVCVSVWIFMMHLLCLILFLSDYLSISYLISDQFIFIKIWRLD